MDRELESFLNERLAPEADQLNRRARRAATLCSRLVKATAEGDLRLVESILRELETLGLEEPLKSANETMGEFDYRDYLANHFAGEFEAACREAKLPLEGDFPAYFVFPLSVRVDVENPSVLISRKRVGMLRPSALVTAIALERERLERSPFNVAEFLGVLLSAWERLNALQSAKNQVQVRQPQPLKQALAIDVETGFRILVQSAGFPPLPVERGRYKELVPFARWRRDYPESFFAFDVQRLLLSGENRVNGWQCNLEKGRDGSNALRLLDRQGQERLITTVNFVRVEE